MQQHVQMSQQLLCAFQVCTLIIVADRKLFAFYSIHISCRHIHDGQRECPNGEDESLEYSCNGLFHCILQARKVCIHPSSICDGNNDCHSEEDEFLGDLPKICPDSCICLMYALHCVTNFLPRINFTQIVEQFVFMKLDMFFLPSGSLFFPAQSPLTVFMWLNSSLEHICPNNKELENNLQLLDFSRNHIKTIPGKCFVGFQQLKILLLMKNKVQSVSQLAFHSLDNLEGLNISQNQLVSSDWLGAVCGLHVLDIRSNGVLHIPEGFSHFSTIKKLFTDDFRLCCLLLTSDTSCSQSPTWPQNCSFLLETKVLEVAIYSILFLVLTLNLGGFMYHLSKLASRRCRKLCVQRAKGRQGAEAYVIHLLFLHLNDLLHGLYLLFLLLHNLLFGDDFIIHFNNWLSSGFCKVLGFSALFVYLSSLFQLNFLTLSRFVAVISPFSRVFKRTNATVKYSLIGVTTIFVVCSIHSAVYFMVENQTLMTLPICSFVGDFKSSGTVVCTTISLAILQTVSLGAITMEYFFMNREITKHKLPDEAQRHSKQQTSSVSGQAVLITVSNALCWLPSAAIYVTSVVLDIYPTQLIVWAVVLISPLNSIANPLLLTYKPFLESLFA